MNTFALELWDDEGTKCTFYTVRKDGAHQNETDLFFDKYHQLPEYKQSVQQLLSFVLDAIGDDHGALDVLFNRFENEVVGLPNRKRVQLGEIVFCYPDFPLRLYALRIKNRKDLVVLFNGGVKSAQTNQQSSGLNLKWREACQYALRIEEAIREGEVIVDTKERKLTSSDKSDEIIL
ncbi:hypothetical protein U0035_15430 [Niabella yanshanensis]|uniref:Uncharacterized protein n=1 Tax=Niabella yanshanensis TaxID=577386 RepID=A0ABZ0W363_9BACT|nr:hypothetical protein [Niabella yanshanensis]WQD37063.1 hypothetical protein U0035_15430 [Niabella yanshanensis]